MASLSGTLRRAMERSGLTLYRIMKDTGIDYTTVFEFYHGRRDVRISTAERLADYLGLELVPRGKARPAKAGRR